MLHAESCPNSTFGMAGETIRSLSVSLLWSNLVRQLQLVIHVLRLARRIKSLAIRGVIKEIGALFSVPPPVTASSSKVSLREV